MNANADGAIGPEKILILGGTGKSGRRVAARLPRARVGSRSGSPRFDWEDATTWGPVLEGMEAVYISFHSDITFPGAAEAIAAFARRAVASGARRLVLLSGRNLPEAERAERGVTESGAEWTVLRASWFCQNFSEEFLQESVRAGEFALPTAPGRTEPFIDLEDLADVAAAALANGDHAGHIYELTGPRPLSMDEAAAAIGAATGREIRFTAVSAEEHTRLLTGQGLPPEPAALLTGLFADVLDGRNSSVTDGVTRALGRPARDFSDYVRTAAAGGAWD
jgi:uncharacterized protein YbjT (DUF2867 family)